MSISQIASKIGESATLKLNAKATQLRARGEPVIHLGGGEPKSKAPADAITAAADLLDTGEIRYTPCDGISALKQAVIRYTEKYYGRKVEPAHVMASGGAKQAIMVCLQAVLDPQDEVLYPIPYWVSYPEMIKLCGARSVLIEPEDGSLHPRLQDFEKKVSARAKAVIINSPNNPSGVMYSANFIRDIVEFCEDRGLYLIMDDIYHRLIFEGNKWPNPCEYAKDLGEDSKLVITNGVSKQYAMTGFRLGWSVANKKLTEVMTNIQTHQTSGPSVVGQRAAVGALNGAQTSVEDLRATLESNRNLMLEQLESFGGVKVTKPAGTFYCLVDFSSYDQDSSRLAAFLLEKVLVVTVPGVEFGLEGYLRLSFCGSIKDITAGIDRMRWALDPSASGELIIGDRKLVRDWT